MGDATSGGDDRRADRAARSGRVGRVGRVGRSGHADEVDAGDTGGPGGRTSDADADVAVSGEPGTPDESVGTLRVVATPIGNLGDLSARAVDALREADLVLAEDTRRTGRLLQHVESAVPQLSLHEHNERERVAEVIARLQAGEQVVLVSDAGTPAVSDPGYRLLAACVAAGLRIEPVPGPSAALAALIASGLPTDRVAFEGFLPRKGAARRARLAELATEPRTMVLFVAPHRAQADLADLAEALGADRPAAIARELTKLHEQVMHGSLAELAERARGGLRGEVTVVIGGAPPALPASRTPDELVDAVRELVAAGATKKAAIAEVAVGAGVPKREVYQAVVDAGP